MPSRPASLRLGYSQEAAPSARLARRASRPEPLRNFGHAVLVLHRKRRPRGTGRKREEAREEEEAARRGLGVLGPRSLVGVLRTPPNLPSREAARSARRHTGNREALALSANVRPRGTRGRGLRGLQQQEQQGLVEQPPTRTPGLPPSSSQFLSLSTWGEMTKARWAEAYRASEENGEAYFLTSSTLRVAVTSAMSLTGIS